MQQRTQSNQKIFNNQNLIVKKLSSGSLGVVFLGVTFQNIKCTIKVEKEENEEEHKLEREGKDLSYHLKQLKRFRFKPENIILGIGRDLSQLYLIDFGMSKVFRDIKHMYKESFKDQQFFLGTKKYASIAAHLGQDVNDLESLMYILLYFLKQQLSSQNMVNVTDDERTKKVGEMNISMECEVSKDQPSQLQRIFDYLRKLQLIKKNPITINYCQSNYKNQNIINLQKRTTITMILIMLKLMKIIRQILAQITNIIKQNWKFFINFIPKQIKLK